MAEALFRRELERRGCRDIEVASSGTWGMDGSPATPEAVETLARLGADLSAHRARSLEVEETRAADLVVAMTSVHVREITEAVPAAAPKIVLLKQLRETVVDEVPPEATPEQRLEVLLAAPRPEALRSHDVDDPMGLSLGSYERTVEELSDAVGRLADLLCGPESPELRRPGRRLK